MGTRDIVDTTKADTYKDMAASAKVEAQKSIPDDLLLVGNSYFQCGYHPSEPYYNPQFAVAMAIIGRLCGDRPGKDYKKGIAFIARELHISKRQVKALRKKMRALDGYVFKVPKCLPEIIEKMIEIFKKYSKNELVSEFFKEENPERFSMYRTVFIGEEYSAIETAARVCGRGSCQEAVYMQLNDMTDKIN